MRSLLIVFTVTLLATFSFAEKVSYEGYQVWSVKIENDQQLKLLQEYQKDSKSGVSILSF